MISSKVLTGSELCTGAVSVIQGVDTSFWYQCRSDRLVLVHIWRMLATGISHVGPSTGVWVLMDCSMTSSLVVRSLWGLHRPKTNKRCVFRIFVGEVMHRGTCRAVCPFSKSHSHTDYRGNLGLVVIFFFSPSMGNWTQKVWKESINTYIYTHIYIYIPNGPLSM